MTAHLTVGNLKKDACGHFAGSFFKGCPIPSIKKTQFYKLGLI